MTASTLHQAMTGIDEHSYRSVFRRHPGGIVVVTADGGRGPAGFTVTSLVSASLDPPLVSFSVARTSSTWPHLRDARSAAVHFLGAHQDGIARRFATSGISRFDHPTRWHRLPSGEPVLDDVPAILRITIQNRIPVGDHFMVIGEVVDIAEGDGTAPLVYHSGGYHRLDHQSRLDG
jgi:flavin reductase (DIM6/NTAB) family NADH-FMN oxidoreductase RutF